MKRILSTNHKAALVKVNKVSRCVFFNKLSATPVPKGKAIKIQDSTLLVLHVQGEIN